MSRSVIVGIGEVLWDMLPGGRQLGGAPANFAYHAAALGAQGVVVSRVGDDEPGREIFRRLDALGLDRRYVTVDPARPTGRVDVRVDSAGVPEYVIHAPVAWDFLEADDSLLDLAAGADAVCFGTLAQRSPATRAAVGAFLRATRPACLRVFDINLRQAYFSRDLVDDLMRRCDVLKLNDAELPVVAKMLDVAGDEPAESIRGMMSRYPLCLVALTRGPGGSVLVSRDGKTSDHPGVAAGQIADTVGAGDAFTAALATGLLAGRPLDRVNDFANRLAAYACSRPGATPAIPADLIAESRAG